MTGNTGTGEADATDTGTDARPGQELRTCTFCDEQFDSSDALRDHEVQEHPMGHVRELERLMDTFQDGAQKVERLKLEKERLANTVERLKDERGDMRHSLAEVKKTRNYLEEELAAMREQSGQNAYERDTDGAAKGTGTEPDTDPMKRIGHRLETKEAGEVELVDPENPDDDEPQLEAVEPGRTVEAWSGFEPSPADDTDGQTDGETGEETGDTASPDQDQAERLRERAREEHEQKVMEASLRETSQVLERIQREAERILEESE